MSKIIYQIAKDVYFFEIGNEFIIIQKENTFVLNLLNVQHKEITKVVKKLTQPSSIDEIKEITNITTINLHKYLEFIDRFIIIKKVDARILIIGRTKLNILLKENLDEDRFAIEYYDSNIYEEHNIIVNSIINNDLVIINQNLLLSPVFNYINNICVQLNKPILNISFDSDGIILGPYINKDSKFCYSCFRKRLHLNNLNRKLIEIETNYKKNKKFRDEDFYNLYKFSELSLTIIKITKIIEGNTTILDKFNKMGIYYIDTKRSDDMKFIKIYPIPYCPICSKNSIVDLYNEKQILKRSNTSNINLSFINNKFGIFRRLIDAKTILHSTDIYYYTIQVPCIYDEINENYLSINYEYNIAGGVSVTKESALGKAIGEACERYCLESYKKNELKNYSINYINKNDYEYLTKIHLFTDWQYQQNNFKFKKLNNNLMILWTSAMNILSNSEILIPASFVYTRYSKEQEENCIGTLTTSGAACGINFNDATYYGILELIERDCAMITWLQKLPVPRVKIESQKIKNKKLLKLLEILDTNNIDIEVFYITLDLEIPCFLVIGTSHNNLLPFKLIGAGCRPNSEDALTRALEEVIQGCGWAKLNNKIKKFDSGIDYKNVIGFQERVSLYAKKEMKKELDFLKKNKEIIELNKILSFELNEYDSYQKCLDIIKNRGLTLIVKDLTTCDIGELGFVVVKVIIPELQQIEADYNYRFLNNPRVYEIPIKLGYSNIITDNRNYNKAPHPFP